MAGRRSSFGKLERDRAKKAKAAAKRERRHERAPDDAGPAGGGDEGVESSTGDLLARIEAVHRRYDAGALSYEDFEEQKAELLSRLRVD